MIAVSVEQAQERLVEIIDTLKPGEEVEIRRGNQAVAKLVGQKRQRQFGLGKGKLRIVSDGDLPEITMQNEENHHATNSTD